MVCQPTGLKTIKNVVSSRLNFSGLLANSSTWSQFLGMTSCWSMPCWSIIILHAFGVGSYYRHCSHYSRSNGGARFFSTGSTSESICIFIEIFVEINRWGLIGWVPCSIPPCWPCFSLLSVYIYVKFGFLEYKQ